MNDGHSIKTALYEPIAPYFTNTYNTLVSVVQGVALAALFYVITKAIEDQIIFEFSVISKIIVSFLFICVIWHRYITHDQYLAWRLDIMDTVIPMLFALLQILLILSISHKTICFSAVFSVICLWGSVAYRNASIKHDLSDTLPLYKEHFSKESEEFSRELLSTVEKFETREKIVFLIMSLVFALISLCIHKTGYSELVYAVIVAIVCALALLYLLWFDLRKILNDNEKLSKYRW